MQKKLPKAKGYLVQAGFRNNYKDFLLNETFYARSLKDIENTLQQCAADFRDGAAYGVRISPAYKDKYGEWCEKDIKRDTRRSQMKGKVLGLENEICEKLSVLKLQYRVSKNYYCVLLRHIMPLKIYPLDVGLKPQTAVTAYYSKTTKKIYFDKKGKEEAKNALINVLEKNFPNDWMAERSIEFFGDIEF